LPHNQKAVSCASGSSFVDVGPNKSPLFQSENDGIFLQYSLRVVVLGEPDCVNSSLTAVSQHFTGGSVSS